MTAITMKAAAPMPSELSKSGGGIPASSLSLTSATGILALLDDPQLTVCLNAIQMLLEVVDFFWYEIADVSERIMFIANHSPENKPAWMLLSKLFFHLGELEKAVGFALKAGELFDLSDESTFTVTIVSKAIDIYVAERVKGQMEMESIDPLLVQLMEKLVGRCFANCEFKQVIGIAIDAHRLDLLESALEKCPDMMLHARYAKLAAETFVADVEYRKDIIDVVGKTLAKHNKLDVAVFLSECELCFEETEASANTEQSFIDKLIDADGSVQSVPELLQICFNTATYGSRQAVSNAIKAAKRLKGDLAEKAMSILDGSQVTRLRLEFLYRNNKADMQIMEKTKDCLNTNNSMHHSVITCSNAIMHCGTTNDEFLRKNMEWLGHATNWAKFTAASSLGVIHRGQGAKGKEVLKPYLPTNDGSGSPYAEGGAMFALGLISAGFSFTMQQADRDYYVDQLKKTDNEVLIHGICLGMGAATMGTCDMEIVELAKTVLYQDNATSGEAAAIAIGLTLHGKGDESLAAELLQYAHESQHEKIIRGISLAIGLIFAGLRDKADTFINQMIADQDPLIRYGGMWAIASAYAGCSDQVPLARLLHAAVSDANDNVRRAAVASLGFVMCQNPSELCRIIELLTESYNPHVRYGAALALGVAFSGTGASQAIALLKPMCTDFTDFVRQGAYVSLAMVMMQNNEISCPEITWARTTFDNVVETKHEDSMAKFGAVLAQGIIDAGGRNSLLQLATPLGLINHQAVSGAILFCQFWYWYPFAHFLSLSLTPTALIAVDTNLCIPKFDVVCHAKPSMFTPPAPIKAATSAAPKKLVTAILSTTAKAAAKAKKSNKLATEMDVDSTATDATIPSDNVPQSPTLMDIDNQPPVTAPEGSKSQEGEANPLSAPTPAPVEEKEPESFKLTNLSRVTFRQLSTIEFPADAKYKPLEQNWRGEIIIVQDTDPKVHSEFYELSDIKSIKNDTKEGDEPAPPAPFEYKEPTTEEKGQNV